MLSSASTSLPRYVWPESISTVTWCPYMAINGQLAGRIVSEVVGGLSCEVKAALTVASLRSLIGIPMVDVMVAVACFSVPVSRC